MFSAILRYQKPVEAPGLSLGSLSTGGFTLKNTRQPPELIPGLRWKPKMGLASDSAPNSAEKINGAPVRLVAPFTM